MAEGNLGQSTGDENSPRQAFGEQWYQERWGEVASDPIAFEQLAKAESLIDAASGLTRMLAADVNALDFNAECHGSDLPTLTSQDRSALGIALVTLLSDASKQMAMARRDSLLLKAAPRLIPENSATLPVWRGASTRARGRAHGFPD